MTGTWETATSLRNTPLARESHKRALGTVRSGTVHCHRSCFPSERKSDSAICVNWVRSLGRTYRQVCAVPTSAIKLQNDGEQYRLVRSAHTSARVGQSNGIKALPEARVHRSRVAAT